jgi:Predicted periplasmic lipoprotein (DUF2279)
LVLEFLLTALVASGGEPWASPSRPLSWSCLAGPAPEDFGLALELPPVVPRIDLDLAAAASPEAGGGSPPAPRKLWIAAVSAGALAGSAYNSFGDGPSQKFHFHNEGWFGRNTYVGGADKASHFVSFDVTARLLTMVYQMLDAPVDESRLLGAGVSALAGLVTEIGDGTTHYGFSYEDLIVDALGAATALATAHYGLDDLIGFRFGIVPAPEVPCCPSGLGRDYSEEIYTGDLKISGLARRWKFNPGPARFLLVSLTYGTKGYPYGAVEVRERQVGIEVGLHLTEIMRALGVPESPWWGKILYFVFDTIRFPYTAIGYQYDLNHRKWRGPGIGDAFPGGP